MTTIPCKICQSPAPLHGVVDRNKSCEAARGRFFPLLHEPVWYHRCEACGFLFTTYFDQWTIEDWRREVYNDRYAEVDPDGADGSRARANAPLVCDFAHRLGATTMLDYGGGDHDLSRLLISRGFDAYSFDPLLGGYRPFHPLPLVTAFEVLEHTTDPLQTARDILSLLQDDGTFLFSTLTLDDLPPQSMDHWYIAPANGHVSIHTRRSLDIMFEALGCQVVHLTDHLHVAARTLQRR